MYKTIEELVKKVDERNTDNKISELIGVSIDKCFIKSVANTNGTDISKYKIIRKNDFAVSLIQELTKVRKYSAITIWWSKRNKIC